MSLIARVVNKIKDKNTELQNLRQIRSITKKIRQNSLHKSSENPVVFFNASTRLGGLSQNAGFSLATSWIVRLAGIPVVHFFCDEGMPLCVLGTNRDNHLSPPPCLKCSNLSKKIFQGSQIWPFNYQKDDDLENQIKDLTLGELITFGYEGIPLGESCLPSVRWILRRHHLIDDSATRHIMRLYILSAWNVKVQLTYLLEDLKPRALVIFNGMFFPEAIARHVALKRGLRVISHEVALRPLTAFFTDGEATAYPIDLPEDFELSIEQETMLDQYLEQRFKGRFSMAGIKFWPEMEGLSEELQIKLDRFKQVVPVFSNVIFDTSQSHANVIYSDMFEWLDMVLKVIQQHPETLFILRAHPDETRPGKESLESVADWVAERHADAQDNLLFIKPDDYLSSYVLILRSKFVMVYNSTIGLEASLLGKAVLCAGRARYTQLPTVFFPADRSDYERLMEKFLCADRVDVPPHFLRNSRRFLYYQLFKTGIPFDRILSDDPNRQGYVMMKAFEWECLLSKNNPSAKAIVDGIENHKSFLLDE